MNAALRETLTPARRPCGSLSVRVMGELSVLRCSGALWLPGAQVDPRRVLPPLRAACLRLGVADRTGTTERAGVADSPGAAR